MSRLLALVSAIIFVDALLFTALTPLVPAYVDEFDLSKAGAGLLVGAYGAGALFGGIPGGLAAARFGPKRAVVGGLVLLAVSCLAFAAADSALTLGAARFVQGLSSTATWAGALAWVAAIAPRERRGEALGTAFGAAIFGAILGSVFGGAAKAIGVPLAFTIVGGLVLGFAALASFARSARTESASLAGLGRAFRDRRFVGGLWLNMLPAMLFGLLIVLTPLALDEAGWGTFAIAGVFFASGLVEVALNPLLGRFSDRVGRLRPIRVGLVASTIVAVTLSVGSGAAVIAVLVCAAAISFGSLYTPGMSLTSHRADAAGLAQGIAFGVMNTAWALGELVGPTAGGALADAAGDAVPYLIGATLCAATLAATYAVTGRVSMRAA
ncbi:MAG TPA: MFS transporter [Gaiellaceae bacterium]|nr:MFS transporter [Gaiellaceae bacterium]